MEIYWKSSGNLLVYAILIRSNLDPNCQPNHPLASPSSRIDRGPRPYGVACITEVITQSDFISSPRSTNRRIQRPYLPCTTGTISNRFNNDGKVNRSVGIRRSKPINQSINPSNSSPCTNWDQEYPSYSITGNRIIQLGHASAFFLLFKNDY